MDAYDFQALDAIKRYHAKYGTYPRYVEATAEHEGKIAQEFIIDEVHIPVVALGTCDIVFRGLLLQSEDSNLEQAKCKTQEKFQRLGAKFARAGCLILELKSNWGQQSSPPFMFYSRIEVFIFGEQGAFDAVMAEGYNHLPGD